MSERDQLREALRVEFERSSIVFADRRGFLDPYGILFAILDQQGWASPQELVDNDADWFKRLQAVEAERDAALREAARYEPTLACLKRVADGWSWGSSPYGAPRNYGWTKGAEIEEATDVEQEVMASLYRQVTEGEEG